MNVTNKPILFSGEMIRALLDGRKTQTRRIVKPRLDEDAKITMGEIGVTKGIAYIGNSTSGGIVTRMPCPYGKPGDLLWVRETYYSGLFPHVYGIIPTIHEDCFGYVADGDYPHGKAYRIRPSIHMSRYVSRLTLLIKDVRVERVQDISQQDAKAEGVDCIKEKVPTSRDAYSYLWDSLNAKRGYSWESNPYVWVIEFEVIKQNIDKYLEKRDQ